MKALSFSRLVLISTVLAAPLAAHAGYTGFTDPALVQARQAFQSALQNQANAQAAIGPISATAQNAAAVANDAQNRANFAAGDLQNLVNQFGGDMDVLGQQRNQVNADLINAGNEIPQLQNGQIPGINNQMANVNADLQSNQGLVGQKQAILAQNQAAVAPAQRAVEQARAALEPAQAAEAQAGAAAQAAQQADAQAQNEVNAANAMVGATNDMMARSTARVNALNSEISTQTNAANADQAAIAKNNADIQKWSAVKPNDPNYKNAQAQIRAAQAQNANLSRELQAAQQSVAAAQNALPQAAAQLTQAQNAVTQANARLSSANQAKASTGEKLAAAQAKLQQQQQITGQLRATFEQNVRNLGATQAAVNAAQNDLNATVAKINQDQAVLANLNNQLQAANNELARDFGIQQNAPQRLAMLDDQLRHLHEAHDRLDRANFDLQQAQVSLQSAQLNLNNANAQYSNATSVAQSAQVQLDTVSSHEAIVYLQGAGGIGLGEAYQQTLAELTPSLSGPNTAASGLTIYNPGVSILWGSQNGTYTGTEAIVLRSATSPASQASNLQGYAGQLAVPAYGNVPAMSIGIGSVINLPVASTIVTPANLAAQLFNALEPQGGLATSQSLDCTLVNLCQVVSSGNNVEIVLPNSIFVLVPAAPSADGSLNFTVQTIALLNTQVLTTTQDLASVINVVAAQ